MGPAGIPRRAARRNVAPGTEGTEGTGSHRDAEKRRFRTSCLYRRLRCSVSLCDAVSSVYSVTVSVTSLTTPRHAIHGGNRRTRRATWSPASAGLEVLLPRNELRRG